jgi:hypothetical protein
MIVGGNSSQEMPLDKALTELVMNCAELFQLETQLSQFNIFRVLRADRNELRHSNMLAWLCNPDESHSLDDLFLRRWLMGVLQQGMAMEALPDGLVSPVAVDVLDIERVQVHREFEHIDLLFAIHTKQGKQWIVCIENKVDAKQGPRQLKRYHDIVESRFSHAERRIYVFLTRHHEQPAHPSYIENSYEEIVQVLDQCLAQREDEIGPEPLLLIKHYRQLLVGDFMEESEASKLARQIYLRHKQALDFIFDNKVDPVFEATAALENMLKEHQDRLGILMARTNKGYVRFLPKEWDRPENRGGTAWGPDSRFLCCEVQFWTKNAELHMTVGKAPDEWADIVWDRAASPPFKQEWKTRPKQFVKPFKAKSDIRIESLLELSDEDIGNRLLSWLETVFSTQRYQEAVTELANLLGQLETA